MALLDELFSALQNGGSTPWAQEALRRMSTGESLSGIDEDLAARRPRQSAAPASIPRQAPPPSADVRNPGNSADPFAAGPARVVSSIGEVNAPASQEAASGTSAVTAREPAPMAPAAPARAAPSGDYSIKPVRDEGPDFSQGAAPIAKFLGLDGILPDNERSRVQKLTYDTLIGKGMNPKTAELFARDPRLLKAALPTLVGKKDEWKMEKVGDDENGRGVYAWVNPRTQEMKPVVRGGMPTVAGPTSADASPAAIAPAMVPDQAAVPSPVTPATALPPPPPGVNPIEYRKEAAKQAAKLSAEKATRDEKLEKTGEQVRGAIEKLAGFPEEFGTEALERSIGPLSADKEPIGEGGGGLFGSGISVGSIARGGAKLIGEAKALMGGAAPTEVRDRIETAAKNLAAVMKPIVRQPGEGVWTDKDQENLEAQLGALTRARTREEYDRRIADLTDNMKRIFQLDLGKITPAPRGENAPTRREDLVAPPATPGDREAVTDMLRRLDRGGR